MKYFILISLIFSILLSCKNSLIKKKQANYKDDKILLSLEVRQKDLNGYYGIIKINNISDSDLSFKISQNIFLNCNSNKYEIQSQNDFLGIENKTANYARRNQIVEINIFIHSKHDIESCDNIIIQLGSDFYKKVKIISKKKSKKEIKSIIDNLGKDESDEKVLFAQ